MHLSLIGGRPGKCKCPNFSFIPGLSCPPDVPCLSRCYAQRLVKFRPAVAQAWTRNLEYWQADRQGFRLDFRRQFEATVCLPRGKLRWGADRFRWFVGGDIPDAAFAEFMAEMAQRYQGIQFMSYTKNWAAAWRLWQTGTPSNLWIRLSAWEDWQPDPDLREKFPIMQYIPKGQAAPVGMAMCPCPGEANNCDECGYLCWSGHDICIHDH